MPISVEEVIKQINHLKNNKSPGTDGLTAEFYMLFIKDLAPFLLKIFIESINNQCLPTTLTQGLITLIPKPKKDLLCLDNCHPISLLKIDYKIFDLIFAKTQSCFRFNYIEFH